MIQLLKRNHDFGEVDMERLLSANSRNLYKTSDIRNCCDLLKKCLKWVPKDRISAAEVLKHPFFDGKEYGPAAAASEKSSFGQNCQI